MLLCLTNTGLPLTLARKTAEYNETNEQHKVPSLVSANLIISLTISITVVIIIFLFANNLKGIFSDERAIPIFLVMLPSLIALSGYSVLRAWFHGNKDFVSYSACEFIEEVFHICLTILLAGGLISALNNELGLAVSFSLSVFITSGILSVMYIKKGGKLAKPKEYKDIITSSTPITTMRLFAGITTTLMAVIIPAQLVLYGMTTSEATTAFGRVVGLAFPLLFIPLAITGSVMIVLIPEISSDNASGNMKAISRKLKETLKLSIIICGLFIGIFMALGKEIGILLYDDATTGEFLKLGSFIIIPIVFNQITTSVMNSLRMEKQTFIHFAVGTVFLLILLYTLPKYIGIDTIIIANGVFNITSVFLNIVYLRRKKILSMRFIHTIILAIVFSISSGYIGLAIYRICSISLPPNISTLFGIAIIVALYLALLICSNTINIGYFYSSIKNRNKLKPIPRTIT